MKITSMASDFVGILASVVKTSRGYMTYIGGCVSKSRMKVSPIASRLEEPLSHKVADVMFW